MGTITLKDGESKKITGLPTGITYKVTESETDSAGFTVDKTGDTGDITTTPAEAKFTNTKEEGGLTVSKSVESPAGSDKSKKFSFKVTLYGASVNGTYGDMTFINSVAEFELSDGQTATATGLAKEIEYTVDETADSNFTTESSGISGVIHEEPGTASFTNKRKTGELEVKKVLVSDAGEDQNKSFQFTIRLGDQTVSGKFGDITFDRGLGTVYLKGGESAKATGLPAGITYTVTEKEESGFTARPENASGTIQAGKTSTATYTNSRNTGDLTVSKILVSDYAADMDQKFNFTVEMTDKSINGTYGDMTFENGVARFQLKGGESLTAKGLPTTIGYVVTEEANGEFERQPEIVSGVIGDQAQEVKFTNTRKTGDLKISKAVVSDAAADADQVFTFTVKVNGLTGEAADKKYGDIQFTNAQATIELKGGESVVATGLPINASYTVIETDNPDFVAVSGIHSGIITETRISEANFTNMRKTGDLEVSKAVVSDAAADADQVFTFTVKVDGLTGEAADKKYGDIQFTGGQATVELKGGQSVKATGLPTGVTYTVTEAVDANFETESEGTSGTIAEGTQSAKFTNTRKTGDLEVSKAVVSDAAADADQVFTFTVKVDGLTDEAADKKYGDMQFTDGEATFELKGGQSVKATGLPTGVTYTVTEAEDANFETDAEGDSGTIAEGTQSAKFTNTRKTGDLEVSKKVVSDKAADADQVFTFTIKVEGLTEEAANKTFGDMTFKDAEATVELKGGESAVATGLPTGVTYTVTEAECEGFVTDSENEAGTIAEGTTNAAFTNTRIVGDLKVSKKVVGTEAEKSQNFNFTVTLDDNSISGKYGDMTFTAGAATFTLTGGETKVAKGLPTTVGYKVVEQTPSGCEVTMTGDTGTIVEATDTRGPASALFINTFASGSKAIYGYKVFRNGDLDKKQFTFALYDEDDELLQKARTDSDGFFEFKPLEYTLNDLANDDGTYDTSRVFKYYVTEVVPSDIDSKGLDKKSMIKYDLSEKPVTVVVTNKGNGVLEASVSGDLNIKFTNIQQDKGKVKTGDTGFGGSLLIFLLASTALIAAISYRRRRQEL